MLAFLEVILLESVRREGAVTRRPSDSAHRQTRRP